MVLFHASAVSQGAARYITGPVEPFDQKNEMFKRPFWDPAHAGLRHEFYEKAAWPRKIPGYRLEDQAAVNASWYLDEISVPDAAGRGTTAYRWDWDGRFTFPRVPPGLRIEDRSPAALSRYVKRMARFFGACLAGVCELDRRWLYAAGFAGTAGNGRAWPIDIPDAYRHAVVLAIEMDYDAIAASPALPASTATGTAYSRMAFTAGLLAQFIRGLGYRAIPCGNDTACSIPIAIDAGLGEIARNGLLITPQYGPRVRLAKVFTDMPLMPDAPIAFGVWEFCRVCKKCADKCPSRSIPHGEPSDRPNNICNRPGVTKWNINAETCLAWWAANGGDCSNCIRVCPFNKPRGLLHDLVRFGIRTAPALNRLFLWGDEVMGYGARRAAGKFWG